MDKRWKADHFLIRGHYYKAIDADLSKISAIGKIENKFVFLDYYEFFKDENPVYRFFNPVTAKEFECSARAALGLPEKHLISAGICMIDRKKYYTGLNYSKKTDWTSMVEHVPYLKSFVEGCVDISPWCEWIEMNHQELSLKMTKQDFMRLNRGGFTAATQILSGLGVEYKPSPRYSWLKENWNFTSIS